MARFDELQAFSQFASDLDKTTQDQLAQGVRLRETLKQPQSQPRAVYEQVAILYAGLNGYLSDLEVNQVTAFVEGFQEYLKNNKTEFKQGVSETKKLGEDEEKALKEAIEEYKKTFLAAA